jgi:hypothetical protein
MNKENWEKEREDRLEKEKIKIHEWKKMSRLEKIKRIKEKMIKPNEKNVSQSPSEIWSTWRITGGKSSQPDGITMPISGDNPDQKQRQPKKKRKLPGWMSPKSLKTEEN